ncbi:MAG: iron-sulfur cluster assembly scaffold protein, partial [Pirellulales bacterium]|nr:iron-sulfur cluster assembly scaffold protein [Pirellulales bacterium]
ISLAAASMLIEKIDGRHVDAVKDFTAEDMLELFGPKLTPNRQKCCLLSWRVLQSAIYARCDGDQEGKGPAEKPRSSQESL